MNFNEYEMNILHEVLYGKGRGARGETEREGKKKSLCQMFSERRPHSVITRHCLI